MKVEVIKFEPLPIQAKMIRKNLNNCSLCKAGLKPTIDKKVEK